MYYLNQSQNPPKRANRAALPIKSQTVTIFISHNVNMISVLFSNLLLHPFQKCYFYKSEKSAKMSKLTN